MVKTFFNSIKDSVTVSIDTSAIALKSFSKNLSQKYQGDDFNYDVAEGQAQNILLRIIKWFFNGLEELFGVHIDPDVYRLVEKIIYFLLIALALYFIVRLLAGKKATSLFSKKSKELAALSYTEEHIKGIDLDNLISEAIAQHKYRLAIRYLYLKTLKELSKNNIISWDFEKTNTDYYNEIKPITIKQNFKDASYLYEYIWYGEFSITQPEFNNAKKTFDSLMLHISKNG